MAAVAADRDGDSPIPELQEGLAADAPARQNSEAQHREVRESLAIAIEASVTRCGRCWYLALLALLVGAGIIVIWSESLYDKYQYDRCNQPLATMLKLFYILLIASLFRSEITRWCCCYNVAADGPEAPTRVKIFKAVLKLFLIVWPLVAAFMLVTTTSDSCSEELRKAVLMIVLYYFLILAVAFILPFSFISVMLCLVRRGLVRAPISGDRAPDGFVDRLPVITYDPDRFNDENGDFSSSCAICLDSFGQGQKISCTPCRQGAGHAFHTECLSGWLQCARTCPLCRLDLVEAVEHSLPTAEQRDPCESANQRRAPGANNV